MVHRGLRTRGQGPLKFDFSNAFNEVRRGKMFQNMFQTVHDELPELYPFVHMCYTSASLLSFGDLVDRCYSELRR